MSLSLSLIIALAPFVPLPQGTAPQACTAPKISSASGVEPIRAHFRDQGRTVVTFLGYSGAGYEDPAAMLARASAVLDTLDPKKAVVNIGATIDGIGAVYELAHKRGFETTGVVSSQARKANATLAPCAGTVFFVEDESWGGLIEGTQTLSPTSTAMVGVSDGILAIGGGEVAREEFEAARRLGKKTEFFPADMNHAIARARAAKSGQKPPTDFRGALGIAMASGGR